MSEYLVRICCECVQANNHNWFSTGTASVGLLQVVLARAEGLHFSAFMFIVGILECIIRWNLYLAIEAR